MSQFKNAIKELLTNKTSFYCLIGGSLRFVGGFSLAYFKPTYFQAVYPEDDVNFGIINAIMASALGFTSALLGGIISDRYRQIPMMKAYICIFSALIAAPAMALCLLKQDNFIISVVTLGLNYLFAESWGSPAITMLMDVTSLQNIGFAISAYLFMTTLSGMAATTALGIVQDKLNAREHKELYGTTLCYFIMFSYLGSIPFFYLAGRSYTKHKN